VNRIFSNASPDAPRYSYEDLRTQVLGGGRGSGLAIFLRHGMREWIEVYGSCTPVRADIGPVQLTADPQHVPPEMRPEIVSILAGLVLHNRWEALQ
jgi:hypothetical protein